MALEEIIKALAHPVRLEFLIWLKSPKESFNIDPEDGEDGVSAGEFERSGLSQSAVSAHLTTLQRAGLLHSKRSGQRVLYRRNEQTIAAFLKALNQTL